MDGGWIRGYDGMGCVCMGWDMLCCMGFGIVRMMLAGDECELQGWMDPRIRKQRDFFRQFYGICLNMSYKYY